MFDTRIYDTAIPYLASSVHQSRYGQTNCEPTGEARGNVGGKSAQSGAAGKRFSAILFWRITRT